jgi:hypothetical protein
MIFTAHVAVCVIFGCYFNSLRRRVYCAAAGPLL